MIPMITSSSIVFNILCKVITSRLQPLQPFHKAPAVLASQDSSDSRFSALIRQRLTGMMLVSCPGLCWSGVLQHCIASATREYENPCLTMRYHEHIWELGIFVGPVPQVWQILRCQRSLDPLYNCYFGFKILWDVWCLLPRKAGVSNAAQTKNARNEQVFCWLW